MPEGDVQIHATADPAKDLIRFEISNNSGQPLPVYEHALPWKGFHSVILLAVKADALGSILDKESPIDDPGPAVTTIEPDSSLEGTVSLTDRFPHFRQERSGFDVLVFWSYKLQPIDAPAEERVGGFVPFPKL